MELPRIFTVGKHTWTLDFVSRKEMPEDWGQCDLNEKHIDIRSGLSAQRTLETYIHEKLHSYECLGIKVPHRLIYQLEKPLAATFRLLLELNK